MYDMEILNLFDDTLNQLIGNTFTIKINHKQLINEMLSKAGIHSNQFETVSSTLDKLDKLSIDLISNELIVKGLTIESIEYLTKLIANTINLSVSDKMKYFKDNSFESINLIENIFNLLIFVGINARFIFDPFLIRGMTYYTGLLYEATYNNTTIMNSSIGGGGRYDNMIKQMNNSNITDPIVPAIGFSIGIERIITILEATTDTEQPKNIIQVFVAPIGNNMIAHKLKLVSELRNMGLNALTSHLSNPKIASNMKEVFDNGIQYMIIIGKQEINSNTVKIKNIEKHEEQTIDRNNIKEYFDNIDLFNKTNH